MSRFTKAAELARRVLGTNRGARNKELMEQMRMNRMLPNRAQNLAETVLRTNPASKAIPIGAVPIKNKIISDLLSPKTLLAGTGVAGALKLSTTDPNDLGREMARMNMTLQQGFDTVSQKAIDIAEMPQIYFMEVEKGYKDEMQRQKEMQNIEEFGSPVEPIVLPPEEEGLKPVSIFMANGGPLDMSDNEPRFEDRSRENQMFSIDTAIGNLMTEYDMVVRNNEFQRAQMIADQIDQLQQQKIDIQSQNVPIVKTAKDLMYDPFAQENRLIDLQLDPAGYGRDEEPRRVQTFVTNTGKFINLMSNGLYEAQIEDPDYPGESFTISMGEPEFKAKFPSAKPTATVLETPPDYISEQLDAIR